LFAKQAYRMAHDPKPPQPKLAAGGVERPRNTSFWRTEKIEPKSWNPLLSSWRGALRKATKERR
jgi:hypothetical protein